MAINMDGLGKSSFAKLRMLCRDGNLMKVREFLDKFDPEQLKNAQKPQITFGYTLLHEIVASGKADVLDYLLEKTNNTHVNCRSGSGYTPLHLAASSGYEECVRTLLRHGADISITDEFGKTPRQTAELCCRAPNIVRLLRSEALLNCNLKTIKEFVEEHDQETVCNILSNRRGVFGYTLLHEAVADGKADVLDYLLEKSSNVHVNCRANSGYTPLHLAASSGHRQCARTLLQHGADISITDDFGKTPRQTAELSSKASIVHLLRSEEIIKEVENDGPRLTELLRSNTDQLEPACLDRALMAATVNDNHFNVGKLVIKGAKNLDECLNHAQKNSKPHACAMLMLIKAALTDNRAIVQKLFGETVDEPSKWEEFNDAELSHVQKVAQSGKVSTVVAIEVARRSKNPQMRRELLWKTDVNKKEGYVYWHGLRLLQLEVGWLSHISWVKKFRLARNGFKSLPDDMGKYLKQVVKIDLQHNELTKIPHCLFELPSLAELNLSHNKLVEIPDVPEWPASLSVLDLSFNQLTTLPSNTVAPGILSLDLSHNNFHVVPFCICSFTTLHSLNLSDNPDILTLPAEMRRLNMLNHLNLTNLKDLIDPPKNLQDPQDCIHYLRSSSLHSSKLRSAKGFYQMKLMLVGAANRGKTTLVRRLQGKECGHVCTVGVDVSEWRFRSSLGKKTFCFSIWDFAGPQEYYTTHQCFLSPQSLCLLLFSLKDGDNGVQELKSWLNTLALQAPQSCVIIVGTHLDEFPEEKREEVDVLLHKVGELSESYNKKLQIVEVMPVGLKNRIENVGLLKEAIYRHAFNYKTRAGLHVMGQKVPISYHVLKKQVEVVQREVRQGVRDPVMQLEEFATMAKQLNMEDLQDEEELKTVTLFLTNAGSLLHFADHHRHNLSKLFFVCPQWLCDIVSRVLTVKERNPFIKNGILHCKHVPLLFKEDRFPWQHFEQYLTILHRLEIALLLDDSQVLIPSMLPPQLPEHLAKEKKDGLFHSRYIFFSSAGTPLGFWDRLLHRIMHSIPQVCSALGKTRSPTLGEKRPVGQASLLEHDLLSSESLPPSQSLSQGQSTSLASNSSSSFPVKDVETDANGKSEASSFPTQLPQSCDSYRLNIPQLLPNSSSYLSIEESQNVQLDYWRTGLYYSSPEPLMFRIESITKSSPNHLEKDGVLIMASPTDQGKKIICQLVDLVFSVIKDWYPCLAGGQHGSTSLEQMVPCFECLKLERPNPFEFRVEHCLSEISQNKTTTECGYHKDNSGKNHTVCLTDIVPDLLLQDIDPSFHLSTEDISYQEHCDSLLEKGDYGKIYRGRCLNKLVAIKKYITHSENSFFNLRSEAKHFQRLHHPCLVSLVGACVQPTMALVLEEPPIRTLRFPILKPVHRLTFFRIVAEVAAALRFLHKQGVILHDFHAANVLLWTLDPASLCHCKVTDFAGPTAIHMPSPVHVTGLQWTKVFVAPEVLHSFKKSQLSVYDHRADIFSFGMFLYQMIARRHPYHNIPPHRIDGLVEAGKRPKLQDVDVASTGYHYLTMLMKKCWEDNPKHRPTTEEIIKTVCHTPVQSVMCVFPIQSKFTLSTAIAVTPANLEAAGMFTKLQNQLWVCCDGEEEGMELIVYNTHTMGERSRNFLKHSKVLCMALCHNNVWVASRESNAGLESGVISIFNIVTQELIRNIQMNHHSISCLTSSKNRVLIGTQEGYCVSYSNNLKHLRNNAKPEIKHVSDHSIDSIACTSECIWVSHTNCISFLHTDSLALKGSVSRHNERDIFIGQLSVSPAEDTIWSAHLGGVILTAWDLHSHTHVFDIDTCKVLTKISSNFDEHDAVITAMIPALDTVWVGMTTGHIMVFHKEELLTWFQPYTEYVRFLSLIPSSGPCEMEKSMVVSGGKGFIPLLENMGPDYEKKDQKDLAGVLVIWEAFEAKTLRQIMLVEKRAPDYLDNHSTVQTMIHDGSFKDGTCIDSMEKSREKRDKITHQEGTPSNLDAQSNARPLSLASPSTGNTVRESNPESSSEPPKDNSRPILKMFYDDTAKEPITMVTTTTQIARETDVFEVVISEHEVVCVRCPRPPQLQVLLSELEVNMSLRKASCKLKYQQASGSIVKVDTQKQLEAYLALAPSKPKLSINLQAL